MKKEIGKVIVGCARKIVKLNVCSTCRGWAYQPSYQQIAKALEESNNEKPN